MNYENLSSLSEIQRLCKLFASNKVGTLAEFSSKLANCHKEGNSWVKNFSSIDFSIYENERYYVISRVLDDFGLVEQMIYKKPEPRIKTTDEKQAELWLDVLKHSDDLEFLVTNYHLTLK